MPGWLQSRHHPHNLLTRYEACANRVGGGVGQDGPTSDSFFTKCLEETKVTDFDERPAHKVTISQAFHLGSTELSWNQGTAFCA